MKICISSGHGKYIRGASGSPVPPQLDEVNEARRVVNRVAELWGASGVQVDVFHDNTSHDQNTNLNTIVNHHNGQTRDLDVSVHFNAFDGSAHGTEVLYVTQETLSADVCDAICVAGNFTNRGAKYRGDLFFLNNTEMPAILIETCFCNNTEDSNKYNATFEAICQAVAETISGVQVPGAPERPPIEPPPDLEVEENRFVMTMQCYGDMVVSINGQEFLAGDQPENCPRITMQMAAQAPDGNLVIQINGQEFHGPFEPQAPVTEANHSNVTATVFGGSDDPNNSAYAPYGPLNDNDLYVALPANVSNAQMRDRGVWVQGPIGKAQAKVADKGPWLVDDDAYVFGVAKSLAAQCYDTQTPLPRGPNAGRVPSNDAAIDLSPALARVVGIDGKGTVSWGFVEAEIA
jgi:hypothetical protein